MIEELENKYVVYLAYASFRTDTAWQFRSATTKITFVHAFTCDQAIYKAKRKLKSNVPEGYKWISAIAVEEV